MNTKTQYINKMVEGLNYNLGHLIEAHRNSNHKEKNMAYKQTKKHIEALYDLGHITYKVAVLLVKKLYKAFKLAYNEAKKTYDEIMEIVKDIKQIRNDIREIKKL